jgi:hypothetical protein
METEQFYKMPKILARADGFFSKIVKEDKPPEPIELTSSAKIVYTYMISRNEFFTGMNAGQHYESQATIADACGLEYKATGKILRMFLDSGVFEGKKLRPDAGQWRWFYHKVHKDIVLWEGTLTDNKIVDSLPVPKPKVERSPSPIQKTAKPYSHVESEEDYNLPF